MGERPLRILFLSWRDHAHPEAGGAEIFLDRVTSWLAERGHSVTIVTARYPGSLATEVIDGRTFIRKGGRFSVYGRSMITTALRGNTADVIVDVQNGIPFWSPAVTRTPVINLVHHVHREQWPEVFGTTRARFGWALESRVAPAIYRNSHYIAVSQATRDELISLGVDADRIEVVVSGLDRPTSDVVYDPDAPPLLSVLGRLVPHKRVEIALRTVVALQEEFPGITLDVLGQGYWLPQLREQARALGIEKSVRFAGFVSEQEKADVLSASAVSLLPSLKEGWGLAIIEAGSLGAPVVAFREAGGVTESVLDGRTGWLAEDEGDFIDKVRGLLRDREQRRVMSDNARIYASGFTWSATAARLEEILTATAQGR